MHRHRRSGLRLIFSALAVLCMTVPSHALSEPAVLHEFIPFDSREDVEFAATTSDGKLPAAVDTLSGTVQAPDTSRMPTPQEKAYGGTSISRGPDANYSPDRDTRRPTVPRYDDPFTPATAPYKRLRAFDAVAPDFSLSVADPSLRPVSEGATVRPGEDVFFGDLTVDLVAGEAVRIPSVGPGARIVRRTSVPVVPFEIVRDSADNWFARALLRTRIRLVEQVAAARDSFGGAFPDGRRGSSRVPPNVARSADSVIASLGLAREGSLRSAVTGLVAYFRAFEASDDPPSGRENIYLDLAMSRKGVCRHRAYAFVVTALAMGIQSRMVLNEIHAWVEVWDGSLWRRIDLGGAAANMESDPDDPDRPRHSVPDDPFPWPKGTDSGAAMADRSRAQQEASNGAAAAGSSGAMTSGPGGTVPRSVPVLSMNAGDPARPPARLSIASSDSRVLRGEPLQLEGSVRNDLGACAYVRVDVLLWDARTARQTPVGSLSTDIEGNFKGAVVVPLEVPVGDYSLLVATPGDAKCAASRTSP